MSKVSRSRDQDELTKEERIYVGSEQICDDEDTQHSPSS
jgi:hypothetical protein